MVQSDLSRIQKIDEGKWKEKRKQNYNSSKTLKRNIRSQEIITMIGEFFMENCYESAIEDIYKDEEHQKKQCSRR